MTFPRLKWPAYKAHKKAVCYECGAPLKDHFPSGHAPGAGAFQGRCSRCPHMQVMNTGGGCQGYAYMTGHGDDYLLMTSLKDECGLPIKWEREPVEVGLYPGGDDVREWCVFPSVKSFALAWGGYEGWRQPDNLAEMATIPGEPLEVHDTGAVLCDTGEEKFYIQLPDGRYILNPETKIALFDSRRAAKEAFHAGTRATTL